MAVNLPNFLSANTPESPFSGLLENAIAGYKASRLPNQMRQQEEYQRLANVLLGHQGVNEEIKSRYLPREYEANIGHTNAVTGLTKQKTEEAIIKNQIERELGRRRELANIGNVEELTRGNRLSNNILDETGMLEKYIDLLGKNLTNKGEMQRQDWFPITKGIESLEGMGRVRRQDQDYELSEEFDRPQRRQEQESRRIANEFNQHKLDLARKFDEEVTQLSVDFQRGEITKQEYDNEIARINSKFQQNLKQAEYDQAILNQESTRAQTEGTRAGTEYTQANTIAQQQKNDIEEEFAREREIASQKFRNGEITAQEYSNQKAKIDAQKHAQIKNLEISQAKANIAQTKASINNIAASTKGQDIKNRLDGKYGEQDRQLAQKQAQGVVEQLQATNTKAWDDIQRQMKFGDAQAAAELQALYDQSQAQQAKMLKDIAEANKHAAAYQGIPEGSVPISELQRGAQTAVLNEQKEMAARIASAEKGLHKLDALETILDRNPEFSDSFMLALTVPDKEGVISSLAKATLPGQNKRKRADAEEFKKLANDLILDLGSATLGARFTDAKFRAMQASKPYLTNTKKANKAVIGHLRKEFEPYKKFKKDFQKARYKYTVQFDPEKYSDIPLDSLSDAEFDAIELAQGLE